MTACGEDNTTKDDNKNTGTENAVDKNNNDSTAPNGTEDDGKRDTRDKDGIVGDTGEAVGDGIEDLGEDIRDGVDDMEDSLERNRDNTGENTNAAGERTHTDTEEAVRPVVAQTRKVLSFFSERGEEQGFFAAESNQPRRRILQNGRYSYIRKEVLNSVIQNIINF